MNTEKYLEEKNISFEKITHSPTYSAQELINSLRETEKNVLKTVLVRTDKEEFMVVLQGEKNIDLEQLKHYLGTEQLYLATEGELKKKFPDCQIGALPPFASQYGIQTIVDSNVTNMKEIVFEGNRHSDAFRMKYSDYYNIERPNVAQIVH